MTSEIRIGLIGNYDAAVLAHKAIPSALQLAGQELAIPIAAEWVPTEEPRPAIEPSWQRSLPRRLDAKT